MLFLASGRGSNFKSFVDHIRLGVLRDVSIEALVANHQSAPVLGIAREAGVLAIEIEGTAGKSFDSKEDREKARINFDNQCLTLVKAYAVDYVLLAGFDQILTKTFVDNVPDRILNIHPAYDLKNFGGKNMVGSKVHSSVIKSGGNFSGCTVHIVRHDVDQGPAILKKKVPLLENETPISLEQRILEFEHLVYPEALQLMVDGRVLLGRENGRCYVDRYSENWDIEWWKRQQAYFNAIHTSNIAYASSV